MCLRRILYPARCILCGEILPVRYGFLRLCGSCLRSLRFGQDHVRILSDDLSCVAAVSYPDIRKAFLRYKFNHYTAAASTFANLMILAWRRHQDDFPPIDAVTWVPVSLLRRFQRGYDQSQIMAKVIAKQLDLPLVPMLSRIRHTRRQERLPSDESRFANVRGVFELREEAFPYRHVLLVDDVITSGATLSEAAWTLRRIGIRCTGLCLANARKNRSPSKSSP